MKHEKMEQLIVEVENDSPSDISEHNTKLRPATKKLIEYALANRCEFFVYSHMDHDDSIELKIDGQDCILLFRQDGSVVTAKSIYLYEDDGDKELIKDFLELF